MIKRDFIFWGTCILSICCGATSLVFSTVVYEIINGLANADSTNWMAVILYCCMLMGITIVAYLLRNILLAKYIKQTNQDIRRKIFYAGFKKNDNSDYLSILSNDVQIIETNYIQPFFDLILYIPMFCFSWGRLMLYNLLHGMIVFFMAVISVTLSFVLRKQIQKRRLHISNCQEIYTSKTKDMFLGIVVVKQFLALKRIQQEHDKYNCLLENSKYQYNFYIAIVEALSTICSMSIFFVSYLLGSYLVTIGKYSISILFASIQLVSHIVSPIQETVVAVNKIIGAKIILGKIKNIADVQENEISKAIPKINSISFNHLSFGFKEGFSYKDFSYTFNSKGKYAIVGESGSGKSTLLNLIVKEHDVDKGQLLYNFEDSINISKEEILSHVSYMNQKVFLFNDTIRNNITMYDTVSDEEYFEAIRKSGVDKFLKQLPDGDQYLIEENGTNLSGGQVQRIALARVLLKKSDVILLDEAFSALDNNTADEILNDLMKLDCMVIQVVHRYNEIILKNCTDILVMKHGKMIENGSFSELIKRNGYFYSLYNYSRFVDV